MEFPNTYVRLKELVKLKEQLLLLKKQKHVKDLNKQLVQLNNLQSELYHSLMDVMVNIGIIKEISFEEVLSTINHDMKMNMNQKCAEHIKSIIKTAVILSNCDIREEENGLLVEVKGIDQLAIRLKSYKAHFQIIIKLISCVEKLTKSNRQIKLEQENNLPVLSVKSCNDSVEEITFSNAIASSPMSSSNKINVQ